MRPAQRGPLGEALLAERERRQLTTRQVAAEMSEWAGFDVPQPIYNRWETGETEPSAQYLDVVFRFLHLDEAEGAVLLLRNRLDRAGLEPIGRRRGRRSGRS